MSTRRRQAWAVLAAALVAQVTVSIVNQGLPTLSPFLRVSLHLNHAQAGFLGTSMYVGGILSTVLGGWAADIVGERRVLVAGGAFTGGLVLLTTLPASYLWITVFMMLAGFGACTPTPAGSRAVMSWFPQSEWGFAMGIRQTGVPIGGAIAAALLPTIAAAAGWHAAVVVAGLLGLVGAATCALMYRNEVPPEEPPAERPRNTRPWDVLTPDICLLAAAGLLLITAQFCVLTYLPSYLNSGWGIPIVTGALYLMVAQLGSVGGRVFWGRASDRWFHGRRKPVMVLLGLGAAAIAFSLGELPKTASPGLILALVGLCGFVTFGWNGLHTTLTSELAGRERAGSAVGFTLTVTQIGIVAGPSLFGHILDVTHSYRLAWTALAGVLLVGTAVVARITERPATQATPSYSGQLPQHSAGR